MRHEKEETEVARMLDREVGVDVADAPEPLDGIERAEVREQLGQAAELAVAQLLDDGFLVAEVRVDDGRRVFDGVGEGAHGDTLGAVLGEYLQGRVENLLADLGALALSSFLDAHGLSP